MGQRSPGRSDGARRDDRAHPPGARTPADATYRPAHLRRRGRSRTRRDGEHQGLGRRGPPSQSPLDLTVWGTRRPSPAPTPAAAAARLPRFSTPSHRTDAPRRPRRAVSMCLGFRLPPQWAPVAPTPRSSPARTRPVSGPRSTARKPCRDWPRGAFVGSMPTPGGAGRRRGGRGRTARCKRWRDANTPAYSSWCGDPTSLPWGTTSIAGPAAMPRVTHHLESRVWRGWLLLGVGRRPRLLRRPGLLDA
jgi:hypothetical protein